MIKVCLFYYYISICSPLQREGLPPLLFLENYDNRGSIRVEASRGDNFLNQYMKKIDPALHPVPPEIPNE